MTGLNLESFLRLLRADIGFGLSLALVTLLVCLVGWTSWGRRRALRKCLVLSIAAHAGLVVYGGDQAARFLRDDGSLVAPPKPESVSSIRLVSDPAPAMPPAEARGLLDAPARARGTLADWDRPGRTGSSTPDLLVARREAPVPTPVLGERPKPNAEVREAPPVLLPEHVAPTRSLPVDEEVEPPSPVLAVGGEDEPVARPERVVADAAPVLPELGERRGAVSASDVVARVASEPPRLTTVRDPLDQVTPPSIPREKTVETPLIASPEPEQRALEIADLPAPAAPRSIAAAGPDLALPDLEPRLTATRGLPAAPSAEPPALARAADAAVPLVAAAPAMEPALPSVALADRDLRLPEIPEVYRSRLAPDRAEKAVAAGASAASEQAVERALAWLARHQDRDGRWNAGTRKQGDGRTSAPNETSFTAHCPAGDECSGECFYHEADTATTGLALLAYLGAGHTQKAGPYAANVTNGLNFLLRMQRADGDLRGESRNVGMYCHAIATLALCEAYALTAEPRLRPAVERAVSFLVRARSTDGQAWRYAPSDPYGGDTSLLGWAILVLKSAREIGLDVPSDVRAGALKWLDRVADGEARGLAFYRPGEGYPVTPTMTAEAWVCRQFLGVGGPGAASDEAASYLLAHGPDRDPFNLYYWYYGTLALYQHGGPSWTQWNDRVRDQIVRRQVRTGHADGSWDPADCRDQYDRRGGRIYTTALAALTLEVYYRYLRLYDTPAQPGSAPVPGPPAVPVGPQMAPGQRESGPDTGVRRTRLESKPATRPARPAPSPFRSRSEVPGL